MLEKQNYFERKGAAGAKQRTTNATKNQYKTTNATRHLQPTLSHNNLINA
jgi:hypothetical protein